MKILVETDEIFKPEWHNKLIFHWLYIDESNTKDSVLKDVVG